MVERLIEYEGNLACQEDFTNVSNEDDSKLSYHHKVPSVLDDLDWNDITQMIHNMDSMPSMNLHARQMARLHKQKILSMRHKLSKEKLMMRASYKGYSFHTYSAKEFQQKASNYIEKTGIYKFINDVNPNNPKVSQKCLKEVIERVDTTLNDLLHCKSITDTHYLLMHPKRSIIRLNYLHFVPDTYKVCFLF
jgi:hypothetical protein